MELEHPVRRSLRSWLWRVPIDQEVEEELALHVEMRRREGKPLDAEEIARVRQACVEIARGRDRQVRIAQWFGELRGDVRFAVRQLGQARGFTAVAALTLALGVGVNSAIFALVDATLLRPLPYPGADRLVVVEERSAVHTGSLRSRIAPLNARDWSAGNRTFEVMAAVYVPPGGGGPALTGTDGVPEIVPNQTVTAHFFDVLGVRPLLGRTFVEPDETAGTPVVVISETLWRSRFGADPSVVGRRVEFDGEPREVVGIVPASFQHVRAAGLWTLYPRPAEDRGRRLFAGLRVIGRLKPGVTPDAAAADIGRIAEGLASRHGDTREGRRITVEPFRAFLIAPELRTTSLLFLGVVSFVLLMCCANVANLVLARGTARARELAVRATLGAGRGRIVRQLLTENLVLAALGGALGVALGSALLDVAPALIPTGLLPGAVTLVFDIRVVTFCALASLGVGVLFGLVPSLQASRGSLTGALTSEGRTATSGSGLMRRGLVMAQTAAAVVLLCGAGLLLRTILVLDSFEPGIDAAPETILTMDVTQTRGAGGRQRRSNEAYLAFYGAVQREVGAVPGVRGVAWATTLPMGNSQTGAQNFEIEGEAPLPESEQPRANYQLVSASYFSTVSLPIVEGRAFATGDTAEGEQVCIVNEAFVRRFLRGRDPLSTRLAVDRFVGQGMPVRRIVGVARQVKGRADETEDMAQIYVPLTQEPWTESYLLVRTTGDAEAMTTSVRAALAKVDRDLPVRSVQTLRAAALETTARYRFRAVLVTTFAGLALVLAVIGLFGVLAHAIQQRRREFGIRLALGATPAGVLALVMGDASKVIAVGLAVGLAGAAATVRAMSAFLFGVEPFDPVTFGGSAALLAVVAAVAAWVPAWRATQVDPAEAFRND